MSRLPVKVPVVLVLVALSLALSDGATVAAARGSGSISGAVYFDADLDGERDPGELPAPDRTVELWLGDEEELVSIMRSGADGRYRFDGLDPNCRYAVRLVPDADFPCVTEDAAFGDGSMATSEADLGIAPPGDRAVSGTVVSDLDEDGVRDEGEPPLTGWRVRLRGYSGASCDIATLTGARGDFEFGRLPAGEFSVSIEAPDPELSARRAVWELTFPTTPLDLPGEYPGMRDSHVRADLQVSRTADLLLGVHVLSGTGAITAWIFRDADLDGARDANESPFDCCGVIFLRRSDVGVLFLQMERDRVGPGQYEATGLPTGEYVVVLATWLPGATGHVDEAGRPLRSLTLTEGEAAVAEFGFGAPVPEATEAPTAEPTEAPTVEPMPKPLLEPTAPAPGVALPATGTGGASSGDALVVVAAVPAVAGALAVAAALLLRRRQARKEGQ